MRRTSTFAMIAFCALGLSAGAMEAAGDAAPAGKLELSPCKVQGLPDGARCGTYEVFENRAARSGRKIPLRVVVLPANAPQRQPDAIAFFAGGPGQSAVGSGTWIAQVLREQGPQTRDVLLVDLRGTGESAPLDCPELTGTQNVQGFLDNFLSIEGVRSCHERLRKTRDLTQYTTEIAVDDVDEVRAALGYDKLNLVGGSYGTRTALVYMRRHPSRVRTAVLSGLVPNDDRSPLLFARSVQNALDGLIAECEGDAACRAAYPKLREEVAAILERTGKEPARAELTDAETGKTFELRLGRNGVAQTLRYMLYDTSTAAQLPLYVHLAAQGDFRPLAGIARDWGSGGLADGFFLAITCSEDVAFIRESEIPAAVAGTFLGDFRIRRQQAACKAWTSAKLGPEFLAPTVSDVPTLLVSGERDPVTPASDGEKVLRHLRRGVHVVIPDGAHGNGGMKGRDCEGEMMARLIETGSTERLDTSCVARMQRPAFAGPGDPEVTVAAADLERLTGTYRSERYGFDARVEVAGGNRLRVHLNDGSPPLLFVPTSPTRFRADGYGAGLVLSFRLEEGRAAGLTPERSGEALGEEMKRVP
jgi:pimeloyl-ACP methyl ester carboxylesterase